MSYLSQELVRWQDVPAVAVQKVQRLLACQAVALQSREVALHWALQLCWRPQLKSVHR